MNLSNMLHRKALLLYKKVKSRGKLTNGIY